MTYQETNAAIQRIVGADADGIWGPNSARATLAYLQVQDGNDAEAQDRATDEGMPEAPLGGSIAPLQDIPHTSQGSEMVKNILLGTHPNPDTCKRSGCLSCAMWCVMTAQGVDASPDSFIEHLVSCGCYDNNSILNQPNAAKEFGFIYKHQQSQYAIKKELRAGRPVILQHRLHGHTHFVVGIGYDAVREWYCIHDPGTQWGNFYDRERLEDEARFLRARDVTRFDICRKKE